MRDVTASGEAVPTLFPPWIKGSYISPSLLVHGLTSNQHDAVKIYASLDLLDLFPGSPYNIPPHPRSLEKIVQLFPWRHSATLARTTPQSKPVSVQQSESSEKCGTLFTTVILRDIYVTEIITHIRVLQ